MSAVMVWAAYLHLKFSHTPRLLQCLGQAISEQAGFSQPDSQRHFPFFLQVPWPLHTAGPTNRSHIFKVSFLRLAELDAFCFRRLSSTESPSAMKEMSTSPFAKAVGQRSAVQSLPR